MSLPREVIAPPLPGLVAKRDWQASAAVRGGAFVFVSGLTAVDPATGEAMRGTTARETQRILENLKLILEAAGSSVERVVKVNVLVHSMLESAGSSLERVVRVHVVLADIADIAEMDRVYREFFPVDPPACTAWSMQLRFGNGCEIECVALVS